MLISMSDRYHVTVTGRENGPYWALTFERRPEIMINQVAPWSRRQCLVPVFRCGLASYPPNG